METRILRDTADPRPLLLFCFEEGLRICEGLGESSEDGARFRRESKRGWNIRKDRPEGRNGGRAGGRGVPEALSTNLERVYRNDKLSDGKNNQGNVNIV